MEFSGQQLQSILVEIHARKSVSMIPSQVFTAAWLLYPTIANEILKQSQVENCRMYSRRWLHWIQLMTFQPTKDRKMLFVVMQVCVLTFHYMYTNNQYRRQFWLTQIQSKVTRNPNLLGPCNFISSLKMVRPGNVVCTMPRQNPKFKKICDSKLLLCKLSWFDSCS